MAKMADLIDRQDVIYAVDAVWTKWDVNTIDRFRDELLEWITAMPSAQSEIIRCSDCRHRGRLECPFGITAFDAPKDDDFCSRAERRTDG